MGYIKRVGIELEGGWDSRPQLTIHGDGSVQARGDYGDGEISSPPLLRAQIPQFLDRNYPDNVDGSCGLHVHTSLCNSSRYAQLMDRSFRDYWHAGMARFGHAYPIKSKLFWDRLAGRHLSSGVNYCADSWNPTDQAATPRKDSVRYAQLNFCYRLHGTLECRVLPMFRDRTVALAAIEAHLSLIESFLKTRSLGIITTESEDVEWDDWSPEIIKESHQFTREYQSELIVESVEPINDAFETVEENF